MVAVNVNRRWGSRGARYEPQYPTPALNTIWDLPVMPEVRPPMPQRPMPRPLNPIQRMAEVRGMEQETEDLTRMTKVLKARRAFIEAQQKAQEWLAEGGGPNLDEARVRAEVEAMRQKAPAPTPEEALSWTRTSPEFQDFITHGGDRGNLLQMRLEAARQQIEGEQGGGVEVGPGVVSLGPRVEGERWKRRWRHGGAHLAAKGLREQNRALRDARARESWRASQPPTAWDVMEHREKMAGLIHPARPPASKMIAGRDYYWKTNPVTGEYEKTEIPVKRQAMSLVMKMVDEGLLTVEQGKQLAMAKVTGDVNDELKFWTGIQEKAAGPHAGFGPKWTPVNPTLFEKANEQIERLIGETGQPQPTLTTGSPGIPPPGLISIWGELNDEEKRTAREAIAKGIPSSKILEEFRSNVVQ